MPSLAHHLVTASGPAPARWMLFLHGILGSGSNWRTFARRLVEARPAWGAVLVDLRMHGASQGFAAPHTVAAAAADLAALAAAVPGPIRGVLGHSFGAKVALDYVRQRDGDLDVAWILDGMPGARPEARGSEATMKILDTLDAMGPTVASREDFAAALAAAGVARSLRDWLAMNLRRDGERYRVGLDLTAIRALLDDYWVRDLWPVLEAPPGRVTVRVVVGGRSGVFDAADRERLARAAERSGGRVRMDVLARAGHWLHVDDPEGIFALVAEGT